MWRDRWLGNAGNGFKKVPRIALIMMGNVVIPGFSSGLPAELIECLPTRLWRLDLGFTHHYSLHELVQITNL